MNTSPLVSVIIPCYNCKRTVIEAVHSVLNQSLQDFEIILVDDASTDDTPAILKELAASDSRVTVYTLEKNSGGAAAPKNLGIEKSQGTYIATLDADDTWHVDKLQKQIDLFRDNPELDYVGCGYYVIKAGSTLAEPASVLIPDANHQTAILVKDYMGPGSCMLYKKSIFDEVGLFDPVFQNNQDWDMRIRLANAGMQVAFIDKPLVNYLIHSNNVSGRSHATILLYLRKITAKHFKTLLKHPKELTLHMFYLAVRHILYGTGLATLWNTRKD